MYTLNFLANTLLLSSVKLVHISIHYMVKFFL